MLILQIIDYVVIDACYIVVKEEEEEDGDDDDDDVAGRWRR